jgi:hypothetical protein
VSSVSDNFNRANGGLGANWTAAGGFSGMAIVSNQVQAGVSATQVESAYTGAALSTINQSVQVKHVAHEAVSVINLNLITGTGASRNGYIGQFFWISDLFRIIRIDAGVESSPLATAAMGTISNGDTLYFERGASGVLKLKVNGATVLSYTDTTYASVWLPAIGGYADTDAVIIDDFLAQDLATGLNGLIATITRRKGT